MRDPQLHPPAMVEYYVWESVSSYSVWEILMGGRGGSRGPMNTKSIDVPPPGHDRLFSRLFHPSLHSPAHCPLYGNMLAGLVWFCSSPLLSQNFAVLINATRISVRFHRDFPRFMSPRPIFGSQRRIHFLRGHWHAAGSHLHTLSPVCDRQTTGCMQLARAVMSSGNAGVREKEVKQRTCGLEGPAQLQPSVCQGQRVPLPAA